MFAASAFSVLLLQFFLSVISAAMLCPVLLCATLLLLTPLEITEARALHPSPDAAQVQREGGGGEGEGEKRKERKERIEKDSEYIDIRE